MRPSTGRTVHYVTAARSGPDEALTYECRAAIVTGVYRTFTYDEEGVLTFGPGPDELQRVNLTVFHAHGVTFEHAAPYDPGPPAGPVGSGLCDGKLHQGHSWHW